MPATRRAPAFGFCAALLCGLALLSAGCYSSPPYGYGYQSSPGFYSSPPGAYQTSPTYPGPGINGSAPVLGAPSSMPPGGSIPPGGTFGPGGSYPSGTFPPNGTFAPNTQPFGQPTPADSGTGNFQRPMDSTPRNYQPLPPPRTSPLDKTVPNYTDPEPFRENPRTPRDSSLPSSPRGTSPKTFQNESDGPTPFKSGSNSTPREMEVETVASSRLAAPAGPELIRDETVVATAAETSTETPRTLYGFDRENYHWLRGTVDYEEEDGTWFVIYNLAPDDSDRYQGGLTIAASDAWLSRMKNGDYVLLEGEVDQDHVDRRNVPIFRVEQVQVVRR